MSHSSNSWGRCRERVLAEQMDENYEIQRQGETRSQGFVIPDLCNVQAISVIVLVGQLLVFVLLLAGGPLSWERLALMSLFTQWVVLASAGLLCVTRHWLAEMSLARGAIFAFLLILAVTFLVGLIADRALTGSFDVFATNIKWTTILSQMAIAAIITGMVLRYFYVQQKLREQEQAELQSRIQALQSRIRPHFLFNSMNIIASLIGTDPDTAESVVEDLSELFRASLNDAGNQVALKEELALCERYMRIEGLRLGNRLHLEWDIGDFPAGLKIPLLTLQPLLENAIYHGIQPLPEGGTIQVSVRYENELLKVSITNPVPNSPRRPAGKGNKMAVANIRSRLHALHGAAAALSADAQGQLYVTELHFPFKTE